MDQFEKLLGLTDELGRAPGEDIAAALALANEIFDTDRAIVSKIEGETYTIGYVATRDGSLHEGMCFPYDKTICSLTLVAGGVFALENMGASEYAAHPAYEFCGVDTYIGAPLIVGGAPYGTLNFSKVAPRSTPWTASDRALVRLIADSVLGILERGSLRARLRGAVEKLDEATAAMREFSAHASHDLRAPMRQIAQLVDLLESRDLAPAQREKYFAMLKRKALHARSLVDALITYARASARGERSETCLDQVISRAIESIQVPMKFRIEVRNPIETVVVEKGALQSVIYNLVRNAIVHHTGDAGRVFITTSREDGRLRLSVEDDGPGIAPERRRQIIEPFQRLAGEGIGLGLAIVARIARVHGGALEIGESEELGGARFSVTLELWQGEAPRAALASGGAL